MTTTQLRKLRHVCLRTRNPVLFMDCDACGLEEESSPRFSPVSRVWWRQRGRRKQSETPGESRAPVQGSRTRGLQRTDCSKPGGPA